MKKPISRISIISIDLKEKHRRTLLSIISISFQEKYQFNRCIVHIRKITNSNAKVKFYESVFRHTFLF